MEFPFLKNMLHDQENDRAVSVLPVVSTVFERLLLKQMSLHVEEYLHHIYVVIEKGLAPNKSFCLY